MRLVYVYYKSLVGSPNQDYVRKSVQFVMTNTDNH